VDRHAVASPSLVAPGLSGAGDVAEGGQEAKRLDETLGHRGVPTMAGCPLCRGGDQAIAGIGGAKVADGRGGRQRRQRIGGDALLGRGAGTVVNLAGRFPRRGARAMGQELLHGDGGQGGVDPGGERTSATVPGPSLGEPEREVLYAPAEGLGNAAIAGRASISRKTDKSHAGNILGKRHPADRRRKADSA